MGFFEKIKSGLAKTVRAMQFSLGEAFSFNAIDEDFYDSLEESLILADVGCDCAELIVERLRNQVESEFMTSPDEVRNALKSILVDVLTKNSAPLKLTTNPSVILVIGVNGVGKTTTIGKLSHQLKAEGKKVLLCAADTFRAAAADQLEIWANRSGLPIVRQEEGADPASVVYDAISSAKSKGADVIICDTAGRLHNKANLMNELAKIGKIIDRELPGADKEVLLVLDAITGQNGLLQAKQFRDFAGVTGIVLTKLDGTAKGGIVFAVANELDIPVKYIGVGEQIDDLMKFDPASFAEAIMEGTL